ncbi:MAG TPA: hypothetical protein VLD63_09090 [Anaerolineales bacterium]|nr:hypothetical protein [Anaerolineales bacterium]
MLIVLPLVAFAILFLLLLAGSEDDETQTFVGSFLRAAVVWGAVVTVSSELLSLIDGLTQLGVGLAWLVVIAAAGVYGLRQGQLSRGWERLRSFRPQWSAAERILVGAMAGFAGVLLVIAWISPPNNVDSLLYHMSRVVHWAQDHSLRHYATARDHQLLKPIWAETAILHLRLLWGSDRPVNLVQWFSMVGSIVGIVGLAARLGAGRAGRFLAAAFVLTIPMGILQSTSTQNDFVVAFWAVTAAYLVVRSTGSSPTTLDRVCLALTLGIGFLTKGTYYVYAPLFVVWYFLARWRQSGFRRMALEGLWMAALALALNVGFWARNVETFGGPYGTSDWLQRNLWIRFESSALPATSDMALAPEGSAHAAAGLALLDDSSPETSNSGSTEAIGSSGPLDILVDFLGRVLRTAAFNLVTPISRWNELVLSILARLPRVFNERYLDQWRNVAWNHEDTAPNPVHFALLLAAAVLTLLPRKSQPAGTARLYTLAVLGTYALIPVVIGHGPGIWGMRYQLPFFVLGGAIVGRLDSWPRLRQGTPIVAAALIVLSIPWLLLNNTRPLVGMTPWPTRIDSILTTSSAEILFASNHRLRASYAEGAALVRANGCTQVGLRIDSDDLEYTFWWLLESPQSGIHIETIYTTERLRPLIDSQFHPCAILCTICGDRQRLHGLPLAAGLDRLDVFLGPGFVPDPDG